MARLDACRKSRKFPRRGIVAEWYSGSITCGSFPKLAKINAFAKSQEEAWQQLSRR